MTARWEALRATAATDVETVVLAARIHGVMGWVRPSGELHAEGEPGELRALVPLLGAIEPARVEGRGGAGKAVIVWDCGTYEQDGRVAFPEALARGHAAFVLHGTKLRGGFVLRRGAKPQWRLSKRDDDEARPGSDILAERPASPLSGRTLAELLG